MHSLTPVLGLKVINVGRFAGSPFGGSGASAPVAENTIAMAAAVDAMPTVFAFTVAPGLVSAVLPLVTNAPTVFNPTVSHAAVAAALLLEDGDELLLESGDKWLVESGAAAKITAFAEMTTPVGTDLALVVDDPGGTPASQKLTFANLFTYLAA